MAKLVTPLEDYKNLGDMLGERWLTVEVGIEHFQELELECRSCAAEYHMPLSFVTWTREKLIAMGARTYQFQGKPLPRLYIPFKGDLAMKMLGSHTFHEIDAVWDNRLRSYVSVRLQVPPIRVVPLTMKDKQR